ncbi:DNA-binding protein [Pyrobaculum arsenaticum]|uniref:DNA-binding protein n=2 Tax=Pyrobaculum arsenaticum TaxID=121277 RepID=A0A7L4PAX8_9CREN|nr:DNA-binding protein [Pyrobaculum arsenaticum]
MKSIRYMPIHPKWLERHYRHFHEALSGAERGDDKWACYNAYVAVRTLLLGILGEDPYAPKMGLYSLPSLARKAMPMLDPEAEKCASCLEDWFGKPAVRCLRCAELLTEALQATLRS